MKKLLLILFLLFPLHGAWGHDMSGETFFICEEEDYGMKRENRVEPLSVEYFSINFETKEVKRLDHMRKKVQGEVNVFNFTDGNISWEIIKPTHLYEGSWIKYSLNRVYGNLQADYNFYYDKPPERTLYNCLIEKKKF